MSELAAAFAGVDWDSLEDVHDAGDKALAALSEPAELGRLFDQLMRDPRLLAMCERFNLFQKIVLIDDPETQLRLRLHVFGDRLVEEAHNHRASFVARILHGSYRHLLYGSATELWPGEAADAPVLVPRWIQDQYPGYTYTLHHEFVHSTFALPDTVSLVVQGPRDRPEFRIVDLTDGAARTRVGADRDTDVQEAGEQRMSSADVAALRERLHRLGLVAPAGDDPVGPRPSPGSDSEGAHS
jgi:hypothetical protein